MQCDVIGFVPKAQFYSQLSNNLGSSVHYNSIIKKSGLVNLVYIEKGQEFGERCLSIFFFQIPFPRD